MRFPFFVPGLLAVAIPYLNLFISLIGALCLSMLGIAFPALIEICLRYPDKFGRMYYILVRDVVLVIVGILAGGLGTFLAIVGIVNAMNTVPAATNGTCSVMT